MADGKSTSQRMGEENETIREWTRGREAREREVGGAVLDAIVINEG